MSLAGNIKIIRKKWKMNQTEFGALINASQYDISSYEKGKYEPKISALIRLEELSSIPVTRLYGQVIEAKEVPALPLKTYRSSPPTSSMVAESPPSYQTREVKDDDLIDVLKLVETVKFLQKKVEQLSEKLKELQQEMEEWRRKRF